MAIVDVALRSLNGDIQHVRVAANSCIEQFRAQLEEGIPAFHAAKLIIGGREVQDGCVEASLSQDSEVQLVVMQAPAKAIATLGESMEILGKAIATLDSGKFPTFRRSLHKVCEKQMERMMPALELLMKVDDLDPVLSKSLLSFASILDEKSPIVQRLCLAFGHAFGRSCKNPTTFVSELLDLYGPLDAASHHTRKFKRFFVVTALADIDAKDGNALQSFENNVAAIAQDLEQYYATATATGTFEQYYVAVLPSAGRLIGRFGDALVIKDFELILRNRKFLRLYLYSSAEESSLQGRQARHHFPRAAVAAEALLASEESALQQEQAQLQKNAAEQGRGPSPAWRPRR